MYNSKALLPARGRVRLLVRFEMRTGRVEREFGYAQSVNVARHYKQMFEEAILNAFYKANHKTGEILFNKDNYAENLSEYVNSLVILSFNFSYYEDRIYSYKRRNVNGRYKYVVRRKNKVYRYVSPRYVKKKDIYRIEDSVI